MRIINGKYRAKNIPVPKSFKDRPTTNFAKEGLFQLLRNRFELDEIEVLDLFAGSGNISYEFVSVNVKSITAVERNSAYTRFIKKQVDRFFPNAIRVVTGDAYKFMQKAILNYDLIFADPPYQDDRITEIPELIFNNNTLRASAVVVVEHSERTDFSTHPYFEETRKYGKARFSFFQKKNNPDV